MRTKKRAQRRQFALDCAKTLLILVLAVLISELLLFLRMGPQNIIVVYVLSVFIISASTNHFAYGLAATFISAFVYDFLISEPRMKFSFTIGFPVTLCIMLLVTFVTTAVTARIKRQAEDAAKKEQRAEQLYEINRKLLTAQDAAAIAEEATAYLAQQMERKVCLYVGDPALETTLCCFAPAPGGNRDWSLFTGEAAREQGHRAYAQGRPDSARQVDFLPVSAEGQVLGVFCVDHSPGAPSKNEQEFLWQMAGQTALALRVQQLSAEQKKAEIVAETEKARSSFLRGISHDLRTPLTSILGASSVLLDSEESLEPAVQKKLVRDIHDDSEWLLRMVENILSVTRLQGRNMAVVKTVEAAEEVVAEAVAATRKRFPACSISVKAPHQLLLVPMDGILISQVLTNLLENALRHGGRADVKVEVEVSEGEGDAVITVRDNGVGIPQDKFARLFEMDSGLAVADAYRGHGMGLSICKTIVEAHKGSIEAGNQTQGGAWFTIRLPLQ